MLQSYASGMRARIHARGRVRTLGYVSDLAQSRRPTPRELQKRESKGVAAHNAFSGHGGGKGGERN